MDTTQAPALLVVEDDPAIRAFITETLRDDGYRVLETPNGQQAIEVVNALPADAERPCLVLLDLMLPGVGGLQVLQQLAAPGG